MSDGLTPMQAHFALLNAKDEVAMDLLAALYAVHPEGDRIFAAMDQRKRIHSYGENPVGFATQEKADRELDTFKARMGEIRELLSHGG